MASIICSTSFPFTSKPHNLSPSLPKFSSKFLGIRNNLKWVGPSRLGPSNGSRLSCWFKFGKSGVDSEGAGIYGSQSRDDFDRDDVEQLVICANSSWSNGKVAPFMIEKSWVRVIEAAFQAEYFNYMGMLAVEGTYDKLEALLRQNIHPIDMLLMLASQEGDRPKIEELLRAGASYNVKDADGRTALDRAASEEIKDFILGVAVQKG